MDTRDVLILVFGAMIGAAIVLDLQRASRLAEERRRIAAALAYGDQLDARVTDLEAMHESIFLARHAAQHLGKSSTDDQAPAEDEGSSKPAHA